MAKKGVPKRDGSGKGKRANRGQGWLCKDSEDGEGEKVKTKHKTSIRKSIELLDKLIDSVEPPHGFYNPKTGEILYVKDIERLKKERANLSGVC